jgi:DNA repair exonuclease SbcCD ATPase subunit
MNHLIFQARAHSSTFRHRQAHSQKKHASDAKATENLLGWSIHPPVLKQAESQCDIRNTSPAGGKRLLSEKSISASHYMVDDSFSMLGAPSIASCTKDSSSINLRAKELLATIERLNNYVQFLRDENRLSSSDEERIRQNKKKIREKEIEIGKLEHQLEALNSLETSKSKNSHGSTIKKIERLQNYIEYLRRDNQCRIKQGASAQQNLAKIDEKEAQIKILREQLESPTYV